MIGRHRDHRHEQAEGEAVGNVRRGMGVVARKLLELEEMKKQGREIMGRERAGEQALNHTYISGPEIIS